MNNRHTPDDQYHSMRDWRQPGSGGPVPSSMEQQASTQPPPTNSSYLYNGPASGQAYYVAEPVQPQVSQPPFPSGNYQQYTSVPAQPHAGNYQGITPNSGQQYTGGPNYSPMPGQNQYPGNQQYSPATGQNQYPSNQNYGPPAGQHTSNQNYGPPASQHPSSQNYGPSAGQYPGYPGNQPQGSPAQGGIYQQYGPVPTAAPPFPSGQHYGQPVSPASTVQPLFYQTNNAHQQSQYNPGPQKRGMGWKALFFVIPVVLIVFASIFGPNVVRNMIDGKHPLANITPPRSQAVVATGLSQQQLQKIQQSNDEMRYKQLARLYVSQMTLDEKIGQLMVVTYNTDDYSQDLDYMLNQQHVGGVIMYQLSFEHQLQSAEQVKRDVAMMQQRATFPLFISIDEEGWNVDRLGSVYPVPPNPKRLAADDMHQSGNPAVATSEGQRVAHDMLALGINVNFAPDVDVATYHGYIDWDYRAFGTTPDDVLKYSAPYLEAMQAGGVIGTLKHFVGLGAVPHGNANDPHFTLPSVDLTQDQLNTDLLPFKHFVQSPNKLDHPGFIMPTDLMVPTIDPKYPTEFSHTFITDILRNQLGYDGVVITDGLQMGGVQLNGQTLTEAYASVLALQAGCDMLLDIAGSDQVASVVTAVKAALQDGTLTQARIDEAVTRIITLKMERNVVPSIQGASPTA